MTNARLPEQYRWLEQERAPRLLVEALLLYGTKEIKGEVSNPVILAWADEVGGWIGDWYDKDEIPWCGLFMAVVAKRAGYPFTQKALAAAEWKNWGNAVAIPMLGDVLVFQRPGGGHVGMYVGEDRDAYHVLGGNQSDQVCITRIGKDRFVAARRSPWQYAQPANVRPVVLAASGALSRNEA
jgi:uncharacterized protein (TIGR02594 family)